MAYLAIEPLDVLHLRGNRLFADSGHGECVMPPWPSVFAGALRTRILADLGVDLSGSGRSSAPDATARAIVGTSRDDSCPLEPGTLPEWCCP
ncbi:MAG: hypothetical protein HY815_31355 [Candidatus Riflebacteria bacterium]|nr:hypothetical protein [Candidatus Riflebacteria bacterium]